MAYARNALYSLPSPVTLMGTPLLPLMRRLLLPSAVVCTKISKMAKVFAVMPKELPPSLFILALRMLFLRRTSPRRRGLYLYLYTFPEKHPVYKIAEPASFSIA